MTRDLRRDPAGPSRQLALMVHAFTVTPATLIPAVEQLRAVRGPTDVLLPKLPLDLFSRASMENVVGDLVRCLDEAWDTGRYDSLVLVGHSIGSLLVRKAYVAGMGPTVRAPFESALAQALDAPRAFPRPWAREVKRIVLLAGINRGWTVSHHMSLTRSLEIGLGLWLNRAAEAVGMDPFTVMAARQGSPFITQLRLQWLALSQEKAADMPAVVQLLGTRDDLVPPDANIDAVTGNGFTYLEVRQSGHADVVRMTCDRTSPDCVAAYAVEDEPEGAPALRATAFRRALADPLGPGDVVPVSVDAFPGPKHDLAAREQAQEGGDKSPRDVVRAVVFVIHGIRDEGYWTERIGSGVRRALEAMHGPGSVHLETSSYGYFPMLSFLRPGARQEKVEWLMDRYTEARARYPDAEFHYIGHSHGTYLLRKAMDDYAGAKFNRVVLAGSVLRTCVDWAHLIQKKRVDQVLNFTATSDWVVAFFPNAMEMVNWQDLGGAGHRGFGACERGAAEHLIQVAGTDAKVPGQIGGYVIGGHSAALDDRAWDGIAAFVAGGTMPPELLPPTSQEHGALVRWLGPVAPLIWVLLAVILLGLALLLWRARWREWIKTLAFVVYLWLVWTVLTQV
ncbi:alpha/beta fold hydrolase [Aquincola sp. J276]|uniref:alpha/beta fold hydrolase n=1 Tax=Aquincola sp. J276 TaxID=2898432 RepID=UPI0021510C0D|nr:alpha/beta hydrolase [Aquincola sp. J276]MCR5868507.1 alpha/beta hydrolase [Aquincola sp. J276]